MSRVNKYRGLRNDEWVYGYYAVIGKRSVIIRLNSESYYSVDENLQKRSGNEIVDVKADTVGQYIGVDDRNGKEIYEWDIVKRKMFDDYVIGQVVWVDVGFCGFMLKCGSSYYHIGKSEHTGISDCDEVIGNVYENADLLKEAENE